MKSIILEKYEREDYIKNVFLLTPEGKGKEVKDVTIFDFDDPLLLKERNYKCSAELLADPKMCHLRPSNLFSYRSVCKYCYFSYSKVDYERTRFIARCERKRIGKT